MPHTHRGEAFGDDLARLMQLGLYRPVTSPGKCRVDMCIMVCGYITLVCCHELPDIGDSPEIIQHNRICRKVGTGASDVYIIKIGGFYGL